MPFASRSRRAVSWSVIVGASGQCCVSQPNPTQDHRGDRLLHHALGHDLALDLHAPIHLATTLLPRLLERSEAAIVNVTTGLVYAPFGATPGYSAAKGGLHAFTRSLRWQTRATRLQVVDLLPPAVETDLTAR